MQPFTPPQVSLPSQALPLLHRAAPPSSTEPSQSSSMPLHVSGAFFVTVTVACALTSTALIALAVAVFVKLPSLQCGAALAEIWTVTDEPGGMFGTFTWSGLFAHTGHDTDQVLAEE